MPMKTRKKESIKSVQPVGPERDGKAFHYKGKKEKMEILMSFIYLFRD